MLPRVTALKIISKTWVKIIDRARIMQPLKQTNQLEWTKSRPDRAQLTENISLASVSVCQVIIIPKTRKVACVEINPLVPLRFSRVHGLHQIEAGRIITEHHGILRQCFRHLGRKVLHSRPIELPDGSKASIEEPTRDRERSYRDDN